MCVIHDDLEWNSVLSLDRRTISGTDGISRADEVQSKLRCAHEAADPVHH